MVIMMKPINIIKEQWHGYNSLQRSAKLYVGITIIWGIFFAGWMLFFNFYILARGFDRQFLGLANSMVPAAILICGIPLGVLSDRIGRKQALILGNILAVTGSSIVLVSSIGVVILAALFLLGIGEALVIVSEAPLIYRLSEPENRNTLFSLNYGMATLSGVIGSVVSGQLPFLGEKLLGVIPGTVSSYQGVLGVMVLFYLTAFIPLFSIKVPESAIENGGAVKFGIWKKNNGNGSIKEKLQNILQKQITWKLITPNLIIGLGAALVIPYMNLFFAEKYGTTDQSLGVLFAVSSLITGLSTLLSPHLAERTGSRIRAVALAQGSSLIFLIMLGFSPWFGVAAVGFLARAALMNMGMPLYDSFAMDQVAEDEQGTLNSLLMMSFELGYAIGPILSGVIQLRYGFTPLFIATLILYSLAVVCVRSFFKGDKDTVVNKQIKLAA